MAREVNEQEFRLIDRVSAGLQTIAGGIGKLRTGLTELNQGAELAAKGIGLVRSAAESIGGAVQGVADYQTAMARVNQITQATAEEQKALAAAVQSAQVELGVSAETSANALVKMARDGFSAQEAVDALGSTLAYAKANFQDSGTAAEQLGGILDSFGEKPAIIGALADSLTATAAAAGTSTEALAKGLQGIGLAADEAGLSVNQTVAILGQLATRNIEGSNATRRMVELLGQVRDPASAAGKALADLGLSGQSFSAVLERLSTDSTAATKVLETLGNRPRAALQALLVDGGGALKGLNKVIAESGGSSKKAADALGGTFNDALQRASAAFDQLKIAAAEPILTPLADGLTALSERLTVLAQSPELANFGKQFAEFVTLSTEKLVGFIAKIDFEEAVGKIGRFTDSTVNNFNKIVTAIELTGKAITLTTDLIVNAAEASNRASLTAVGPAARGFELLRDKLTEVNAEIPALSTAVGGWSNDIGTFGDSAQAAGRRIDALGKASRLTADDMQALALAALPGPLRAVAEAAIAAATEINKVAPPTDEAKAAMERLTGSAYEVALAFERLQVATYSSAIADLARANLSGSDTFKALVREVGAAEARIKALTDAHESAAKAADDQSASTDNAARSVRNFGDAAEDTGRRAADAGDEIDGASKQTENWGNNAQAAAFSLGNMSEAALSARTAAAAATGTLRGYINEMEHLTDAYQVQNAAYEDELALIQRQIDARDEDLIGIAKLRDQYTELSDVALERLWQAKKRLLNLDEKQAKQSRDTLAAEQQLTAFRAGGAIGAQGPQAQQQTGTTTAAPAATGGGGKGDIIINVSGILTDDLARDIAERVRRVERLAR